MKKLLCASALLTCACLLSPALANPMPWLPANPRGDELVMDHPPLNTGGLGSDTSFIGMSGFPTWQQVADDFVLDQSVPIGRMAWWGFYGSTFDEHPEPPPTMETMRVRIYSARLDDGLPGELLFEEAFVDPPRVATGREILTGASPPEYVYSVEFENPIRLNSAIVYWLEVVQVGDVDSHFRWEVSVAERSGQAVSNLGTPAWHSTLPALNADTAYQLYAIPEPTTMSLLLGGLFIVSRVKGKERR